MLPLNPWPDDKAQQGLDLLAFCGSERELAQERRQDGLGLQKRKCAPDTAASARELGERKSE